LGLGGRHPIEKVGERWCGSRVPIIGPHVEGAVGFGDVAAHTSVHTKVSKKPNGILEWEILSENAHRTAQPPDASFPA
jgi:hypothetical protein